MPTAYLIIAHGSRETRANEAFFEFLEKFRKTYPKKKVQGAFLELASPNIPDAIEKCVQTKADSIVIIPLMLFPGRHVKEDIPHIMEEAKAKHPELDFHYAGPLSDHPMLMSLMEEKLGCFVTVRGH